jgi:hypothetical protein
MKEIGSSEIPKKGRQHLPYDCLETVALHGDGSHKRRFLP